MRRRGNRSLLYISGIFNRFLLIIATFICSVVGNSAGQNPASRPILFVHGFCGTSDAWQTLRDPLFSKLQSQFPELYPYPTPSDVTPQNLSGNYDVYYDSVALETTFLLNGAPIPEDTIPANARFFSIRFYDPYAGQFNPTNVAQISILNQADQLAHVVAEITKITQIEDVILVTHSMGGLSSRASLENLASPFSCSTYNGGSNGVPDYTDGCTPGATAYQPNIARLINLDTPNAGTNLAQSFLDGLYPGCIDIPSTTRVEMTPASQFLQTLNYYETDIATAAPVPPQVKVQSIESFYSDPNNFPGFLLLGWLPGAQHDTIVGSSSQSVASSLNPSFLTVGQFPGWRNPFTVGSIIVQTPCQQNIDIGTVPVLHFIQCVGSQPNTLGLVYSLVKPIVHGTFALATLTPATLSFGDDAIGNASVPRTATLKNAQTVPLTISSIVISGGTAPGDYAWGGNCPISPNTLGGTLSCEIILTFTPSALGSRTASLIVTDSASNSPQAIALTGTGAAPVTVYPTSLTFTTQLMGTTSAAKTITLTNHLNSALDFLSISASGDFAVASNTCGSSVGAGLSCTIGVTFAPTAIGKRTGTLTISDGAAGSPTLVALSGTGNDTGLTSITVTPANPTLAAGNTLQFTATGNFTSGSTENLTPFVAWNSSNTSVATIAPGGLATAATAGTSTISAKMGSKTGSTTLTATVVVQSENVLYNFTGGSDGSLPYAGLIFDSVGNLYGTTYEGGANGAGTVFELTPSNGGWTETVLYNFCTQSNCSDGDDPLGSLIFDSAGNLYGTTSGGGTHQYGTIFILRPSAGSWAETVLYSFQGGTDGEFPVAGVTLDNAGNLYGTTEYGGVSNYGTVFELNTSGNETVLYSFIDGTDGAFPYAGVILDAAGNLYGTTISGGNGGYQGCGSGYGQGCGTVFMLKPSEGGSWTESILYSFSWGTGPVLPYSGLIFDYAGNLYGTATLFGNGFLGGGVFELTYSNGSWTEKVLYNFTGGSDGGNPYAGLAFDSAGNLYGTTQGGGANGDGTVFKLGSSNGEWTETVLHSFAGSDGCEPYAGVIFDAIGNLYGTTSQSSGCPSADSGGVVFEIGSASLSLPLQNRNAFDAKVISVF